jgi:hypothetical protein
MDVIFKSQRSIISHISQLRKDRFNKGTFFVNLFERRRISAEKTTEIIFRKILVSITIIFAAFI